MPTGQLQLQSDHDNSRLGYQLLVYLYKFAVSGIARLTVVW